MSCQKLGLIAGNGKFPFLFAHEAKKQNFKVIAGGVEGDTSFFLRFFVSNYAQFKVGELKKLFCYFKDQGVDRVIMAGQVNQDNLFDPKVQFDEEFQSVFDAIKDRKADTIFSAVADKLKEYGIELVESTFLLKKYLAPKGALTKRGPSLNELEDIQFGQEIAKSMGDIDVGQTVVVKDKAIVAIEAMEGTDRTIVRGGQIARDGAVVVKMSKPNQDLRFDVPVIGSKTIKSMIKCKAKCLGIEAGKTLLIDEKSILNLANKAGICIVAA
ncbi:UDP-2,3-diacylglucosamine pyrophosphatase [hydrothermal vent metagenome]|uniref:UDP-2,3-diacylglucosamine pyrophosphatase n=1 Tax=hydrothermal vent metagenome TaxID=652676 RepID=A0A3B1D853_9ZZZZ